MPALRIGDQLIRFDREATIGPIPPSLRAGLTVATAPVAAISLVRETTFIPWSFVICYALWALILARKVKLFTTVPQENSSSTEGWFYFVGELLENGESIVSISRVSTLLNAKQQPSPVPDKFQYFIHPGVPATASSFRQNCCRC